MGVAIAMKEEIPKAVCYRCRYIGHDDGHHRCPKCEFPLIVEHGCVGDDRPAVREIFDRTSVSINAPPLPGVDGRPRKAQLLAEARRDRRRLTRLQAAARPEAEKAVRYPTLKVACAFVSARFAGLGAAVLMNGGL